LQRRLHQLKAKRDGYVNLVNRVVVRHEIAHQCLFSFGVHRPVVGNPAWLVEGLACQFETPTPFLRSGVARVNENRLADLREAFDLNEEPGTASKPPALPRDLPAAYPRISDTNGRLLPLRDLVKNPRSLSRSNDDPNLLYRYAQSWALVFYLQRQYPEKWVKYVTIVAQRPLDVTFNADQETAQFETAFGQLDDEFQNRWIKFILGQQPSKR